MSVLAEFRRRLRDIVGPVLGLSMLAYFAYHALEGDRGMFAFFRVSEQIVETRAQLDELRAERVALERRVTGLRPDSLDRDLLEERARAVLNYARPGEVVVRDPAANSAPPR